MKPNEMETCEHAQLETTVLSLLQTASGRSDLPSSDASLGSLGMDSLKLVEVIFELETRLGIIADEERMATLQTVSDLIAMIAAACEARHCAAQD